MKVLTKVENFFAALFFISGIAVSLYAVFMRYIIGHSQSWATEIFTMLLVWAIFIGFATALRDNAHIAIDIVYDRVGPNVKKIFEIVTLIFGISFSIFFIWTGTQMVLAAYSQGIKTIDAGFPIWIYYLIMPVGGLLLLIRFIEKAFRFFTKDVTTETEVESEWQQ